MNVNLFCGGCFLAVGLVSLSHIEKPGATMGQNPAENVANAGTGTGGSELVMNFEDFQACPYQDASQVSIGYGSGRNAKGKPVKLGDDCITQTEAYDLHSRDMNEAYAAVDEAVTVRLNAGQREALGSFVYNVGADGFAKSTALARLNAGDTRGAAQELHRWNKTTDSAGRVIESNGLTKRRAAEAELLSNKAVKEGT